MSKVVDLTARRAASATSAATEATTAEPAEPNIWVCACGCSTFELCSDATATCAACGHKPDPEEGGWFTPPDTTNMWEGDTPVRDISGNGSVEFARYQLSNHAAAPDAALIVVVKEDGTRHAWCNSETDEQVEWAERALAKAAQTIRDAHDNRKLK